MQMMMMMMKKREIENKNEHIVIQLVIKFIQQDTTDTDGYYSFLLFSKKNNV